MRKELTSKEGVLFGREKGVLSDRFVVCALSRVDKLGLSSCAFIQFNYNTSRTKVIECKMLTLSFYIVRLVLCDKSWIMIKAWKMLTMYHFIA